jgi:hypothetical protein
MNGGKRQDTALGRDQAQLEAFFTSGTSIKMTLQITVK